MAGEIDAIAVVESDLSTHKPPDSIEMLKELSIQMQNDVSCLPVPNVPTDISKNSEVENCIQPCSSQPCMESSLVDDSSTHKLPESIGMLKELSITDLTASSCETQDCKENHSDVICVPVVSDPIDTLKKIKVENGIQPCLETLKSSPVDDSSTHKPQGSVGMLKELSITDLIATGCETLEENHNDVNCLPAVSDPTDSSKNSEVENRIQPCSLQPCLETLEISPDLSTHKPQVSVGMGKELSITHFTVTGQNVERNHNDVDRLPVVSDPTDSLKKSEVENRIQPCSLQPCLETQESSPVEDLSTYKPQGSIGMLKELSITDFAVTCCEAQNVEENHNDLLGNYSQENERKDDKSVSSPFEEGASGVVEQESDVTTEIKDETLHQKLCIGGYAYDLKGDSPDIPLNSLESFLPVNITEDRSPGKPGASRPFEKAAFCGVSTWSAAESDELKDIEGKDLAGTSSPTGLPKNGPSFSCRSSRVHISSHKTQPKRASRKSKNKAKVQDLHIFMAERKRRTCFSKPARSSYWGLLGNIDKFFEHTNRLGLNKIHNSEPTQRKLSQESRKQSKSRASGSSQGSGEKKNTSTSCIRLKVKVGNEVFRSIIVSDAFGSSVFGGVSDFEMKSRAGTNSEVPSFVNGNEDKMRAVGIDKQLQCFDSQLGEAKLQSDTSVMDLHLSDKDLEGTGVSQKRYTDPGTSPDSEVINLVPYSQANTRSPENLPLLSNFAPAVISISKRGKTKDIVSDVSDCFPGDIASQLACANKAKDKKKQGTKKSKDNGNFSCEILRSSMDANALSNSLSIKDSSQELSHLSSKNDILVGEANKLYAGLDSDHKSLESQFPNHLLPSKKSKVRRLPKNSRGASNGRSEVSDKAGINRENARKQKVKGRKSINQKKVKEKDDCGDNNCKTEEGDMKTGSCILDGIGKIISDSNTALLEVPNVDLASSNIAEQHISVDNAWVSCDDCHKWRRIPVALVDSIGQTNCQWICKDNTDKAFADCSIPQEKSNAEINAELGISDADEDAHDAPSKSKSLECKRPGFITNEHEFTLLSSNRFLHRSRKTQTIDEIMVCHCKLPLDGRLGCGDECLNRMLNIECVQGTCPCGDLCSNQQFQKRTYVKMKWDRCGKKGFGLWSEEDISEGHFLIEYVGEVLDMHTYEARQREYAFNSHKHFYFMTLNGSEVIDACAKGNLGRFINHSCDPNCRTEKWVVNGEICIGLFALRDIKKGEEVTFDYNYVRVFGAAAKKCYCGSFNCRGYIGGDPTSTEVIDQVDSDEEFLEPVMLEDGKTGSTFKNSKSRSSSLNDEPRVTEIISEDKNKIDHPKVPEVKLEVASEIQDAVDQSNSDVSQLNPSFQSDDSKANIPPSCQAAEISATSNDIISKSVPAANHEISMEENQRCEPSPSDGIIAKLKSKSSIVEEKRVFVKSRFLIKTSRESSSSKKGKVASNHLNANRLPTLANKSQMLSIKPKKFMHGTSNGRLETVEEKLNELLDVDGGISKKKDAAKGYLKFLVHTATSGASGNGEAIQSNRDLSMILDALLKTKSRVVLVDIINKNGLRMLHNMIKQYRKDFKKTPILRKLLKALEYLAVREILTQEHINGGPPCPGMESFRESILSLTEHDDKQVHQIARNFRDRWIPRHSRRHGNMDRDEGRMDFRRNSTTNRIQNHSHDVAASPAHAIDSQPKPETTPVDPTVSDGRSGSCGTKRRKRKSRWDQPAPTKPSEPNAGKYMLDHVEEGTEESYCPHCARNYSGQDETSSADSTRQNILSDVPPGFSSITNLPEQNDGLKFPEGMVVGYQQKKFDSRSSVSYGIPMPIMQKFEGPQDGTKERWGIAPGMPFHPFPPLPPFPPREEDSRSSPPANSTAVNETTENEHFRHDNNPSTSGYNQLDTESPVESEQHSFKRARASQDLGKRFFRQQKWNKALPPWVRHRDGWAYSGNNSRDGLYRDDVGNVTYEQEYISKISKIVP